jgi:molybdopterin synthase catalytic subunit
VDQDLAESIRREGEAMPGMFRVLVEAKAGTFVPGDDLLFIVAAGDIREHVIAALTHTLTRVKSEAIVKRELPA